MFFILLLLLFNIYLFSFIIKPSFYTPNQPKPSEKVVKDLIAAADAQESPFVAFQHQFQAAGSDPHPAYAEYQVCFLIFCKLQFLIFVFFLFLRVCVEIVSSNWLWLWCL